LVFDGQPAQSLDESELGEAGLSPGYRPSTLISSVQRAIRLLEAVAGHESAVPAKVLARDSGLPLGTAYHLLRTLTFEGYLRRLPDGRYVLGEGVIRLLDHSRSQATLSRARAALLALRDHVRAATYLSFFENGEIVIKDIVDTPRHPRIDLWVGFRDAAHATALGKCVLATLEKVQLEDYLSRHGLPDLTPHTLTTQEALVRNLQGVRATGFAVDRQEYALGTVCAAVPVVTSDTIAAVAVSLPARREAELGSIVEPLVYTARRISRAISLPN
jgi:IclR family transcriptional regulator, acetate operon repressor